MDSLIRQAATALVASGPTGSGLVLGILTFAATGVPVASAQNGFYLGGGVGLSRVDSRADAQTGVEFFFPLPPEQPAFSEAGIDGIVFDDRRSLQSVLVGYRLNQYLAIELDFADLGDFQAEESDNTITRTGSANLQIDLYALSLKARYPLSERVFANWRFGLLEADFDVEGEAEVVLALSFPGDAVFSLREPFDAPKSETGYLFGFGIEWELTPRFGLELGYTKYETRVVDTDSLRLGVIFSLNAGNSP